MTSPDALFDRSASPGDRAVGGGRLVHAFAVLTAAAIVPLILVGAGVTSKGAGMVFPDWPTSDRSWLNPPGWLGEDHKLWEHGHRLLGWLVGMLAIGLAVCAWPKRGWVRAAAIGTLVAITLQGILGGLRVTEISTTLAMVHGIWGQVCFCLSCVTVLITSDAWRVSTAATVASPAARSFRRLALISTACLFFQLVVGAAFRHFGLRWALAGHLIGAVVVILLLGCTAMWALEQFGAVRMLSWLGRWLVVLTAVQLFLGGAALLVTVMGGSWPGLLAWAVPSAHVVIGAMLLACMVVLTLCCSRVLRPQTRSTDRACPSVTAATT